MARRDQPSVSMTSDGLVIRIPWNVVNVPADPSRKTRSLTIQDVRALVDASRLAHRLGKTRAVRSLKERGD